MIDIPIGRIFFMFDDAWIAKNNAMAWHIAINIGIGRNKNIVTYDNISYNGCIDANPYFITNCRCAFSSSPILLPQGSSLMDIAVLSNYSLRIDGNTIGMA